MRNGIQLGWWKGDAVFNKAFNYLTLTCMPVIMLIKTKFKNKITKQKHYCYYWKNNNLMG